MPSVIHFADELNCKTELRLEASRKTTVLLETNWNESRQSGGRNRKSSLSMYWKHRFDAKVGIRLEEA
jgi:hypothetical protein